jgi:valyl-tRNA synthetase
MDRYSPDAIRYWAACTGFGRDSVINEEKMQAGHRLAVKLWNVARFAQRFHGHAVARRRPDGHLPSDRWLLSRLQRATREATEAFEGYEYAAAKSAVEAFFWRDLADNYVELAKKRLYAEGEPGKEAARAVLHRAVAAVVKLLAPFMPYVTEAIYQALFAGEEHCSSVHRARWPEPAEELLDHEAELLGEELVGIAAAVRRYKTEHEVPLGSGLAAVTLASADAALRGSLELSRPDIVSVTRAQVLEIVPELPRGSTPLVTGGSVKVVVH